MKTTKTSHEYVKHVQRSLFPKESSFGPQDESRGTTLSSREIAITGDQYLFKYAPKSAYPVAHEGYRASSAGPAEQSAEMYSPSPKPPLDTQSETGQISKESEASKAGTPHSTADDSASTTATPAGTRRASSRAKTPSLFSVRHKSHNPAAPFTTRSSGGSLFASTPKSPVPKRHSTRLSSPFPSRRRSASPRKQSPRPSSGSPRILRSREQETERQSFHDLYREYIASCFWQVLLPDRASSVEIVNLSDTDLRNQPLITIATKFFQSFTTLEQYYRRFKSSLDSYREILSQAEGFASILICAVYLNDWDWNSGNIGEKENIFIKLDHGRSGNGRPNPKLRSGKEVLLAIVENLNSTHGYTETAGSRAPMRLKISLVEMREMIARIYALPPEQVREIIRVRLHALREHGMQISEDVDVKFYRSLEQRKLLLIEMDRILYNIQRASQIGSLRSTDGAIITDLSIEWIYHIRRGSIDIDKIPDFLTQRLVHQAMQHQPFREMLPSLIGGASRETPSIPSIAEPIYHVDLSTLRPVILDIARLSQHFSNPPHLAELQEKILSIKDKAIKDGIVLLVAQYIRFKAGLFRLL